MRYFDHNATTRVDPEVIEVMIPFLQTHWGNPSSAYRFARPVKQALQQARAQVASLIRAQPEEILFTGCGTESINTALHLGAMVGRGQRHAIVTLVEHEANLRYAAYLESQGWEITRLGVDGQGLLDPQAVKDAIREDTAMVSVMWANNETGVLLPIHDIAMCCRDRGILFHTDAVQAIGKIPVHVDEVPVDLLSLSAHKMNAPKGVGALYIRKGTPFAPFLHGGGQEAGRRAGTQNMAGIVGLGKAAELASARLSQKNQVGALRDHLEQGMLRSIPNLKVNGHPTLRLPNTSNVCFDGIEAEALLHQLDRLEVAASSGSACSSGSLEPSHVLTAMGLSPRQALSSIRFSLGIETCQEEVDYLLLHLPEQVRRLRGYSPLNQ